MLKGYTLPRTPKGVTSLAPMPPWYYVGNCLAIEYEAKPESVKSFLPPGLNFTSSQCAVYFVEWQYVSEEGDEYLDPVRSQYHETIFLYSAGYEDSTVSFCPFIWVDQDVSLMRGYAQGWPKQIGSTWITRAYDLPSRATPIVGPGGKFGATLAVKERRIADAVITLEEETSTPPTPGFAKAVNTRHFPELVAGKHDKPAVYELVQLKSSEVKISLIWKGSASLKVYCHPYLEIGELAPVRVISGYRFSCAITVDDLIFLRDLRFA